MVSLYLKYVVIGAGIITGILLPILIFFVIIIQIMKIYTAYMKRKAETMLKIASSLSSTIGLMNDSLRTHKSKPETHH